MAATAPSFTAAAVAQGVRARCRGKNSLTRAPSLSTTVTGASRNSGGHVHDEGGALAVPPVRRAPPIRRTVGDEGNASTEAPHSLPQSTALRFEVQLNHRLRRAHRYSVVLYLIRRHIQEFDFINCATAMSRLGHLSVSLGSSEHQALCGSMELSLLLAKIENSMWDFNPQAMANTIWALGRLRHNPGGQFLQVLADRALWCLNSFKPQEMSNLVWGVAGITADAAHGHSDGQIDFRDPESGVLVELLNSLCEQATIRIYEFGTRELCQLLWGLGKLGFYHPHFMKAMSECLQQRDTDFNEQDLSNIAWACAALRFYDDSLLAHLDNLAASTAARMSPLASSSLLTSFAKLGYRDGRSAALLAEQAALQPGALSRQQLCNVLWALGALQSAEVSLAKSLGRELEQRLMGEDEHGARLDYSQVFHAGMMMNMQWKTGNARTVMGLSGGTWARMRDAWMEVVEEQGGQTSALQRQVSEVLDRLHVEHSFNCVTRDGLMCVGISVGSAPRSVALEVESTDHYSVNGTHRALGERIVRRQLLKARGWELGVVNAHKWNRLSSPWDKALYLAGVLSTCGIKSMEPQDTPPT